MLRLLAGTEAAEQAGAPPFVWIRGRDLTDEVDAALRCVPGLERFLLLPGDLLAEPSARVPSARLPSLTWSPIANVFAVTVPASGEAGERPASGRIRIAPSATERTATALLTDVTAWEEWCALAPEVRLARLRFAACSDGRVLVRGVPLPPIRGATPLWDDADVLIPCGHAPDPDVVGAAFRPALGLTDGDVALLSTDGEFDIVPGAHFAAASRSAARLTRRRRAGA